MKKEKEKGQGQKNQTKTTPNCQFFTLPPVKKSQTKPPPMWLAQAVSDGALATQ